MIQRSDIQPAVQAAIPIMLGYVAIGIPCGILEDSIGMNALQVFFLSCMFYSGAGQFMIPNMWLAGSPLASIIASVSLVNTRQMLYSASFAPMCANERKRLSFLFSATVTDESFGVNMANFATGTWNVPRATIVNICSCTSWTLSNVAGVLIGGALGIPLAIASFAMTSIFICLLVTQNITFENVVAAVVAIVGVFTCKAVGLAGPAILVGAILGVVAAMLVSQVRRQRRAEDAAFDVLVSNPPYIPSALVEELPAEVGGFEPRLALDGGPDGLDVFRRIVALAGTALKPGGLLACELHEECLEQACDEAVSGGLLQNARIVKDLAGKNRILLAERL